MSAVSFSSWNGKIVDNRTGKAAKAVDAGVPKMLGDKSFTALMGWNGMVVTDAGANVPSLALAYLKEARKLSCGECSVCSIGIDKLTALLEGLIAGKGKKQDIAEIERDRQGGHGATPSATSAAPRPLPPSSMPSGTTRTIFSP